MPVPEPRVMLVPSHRACCEARCRRVPPDLTPMAPSLHQQGPFNADCWFRVQPQKLLYRPVDTYEENSTGTSAPVHVSACPSPAFTRSTNARCMLLAIAVIPYHAQKLLLSPARHARK